jgi:4a-hydroxytetrahydrobiopterin dehydratase
MKVPEIQVIDLARERCEDCRPGTPTLAPEVARELASGLHPDWVLSEAWIERTFVFKSFNAAFGLATRVALLAEAQGHHPDLEVGWGRLSVRLATHAIGGLSRNDLIMAAKIDQLAG